MFIVAIVGDVLGYLLPLTTVGRMVESITGDIKEEGRIQ